MKRWFNYFKDNITVRIFFILLLGMMFFIEIYRSENFSELYQILWIQEGTNVLETMQLNSGHVLYYVVPIILVLNIPTGILLHTSVMERVRVRSRRVYFIKAIKYTAVTTLIYVAITGAVIYFGTHQKVMHTGLEVWGLPFLRVMNLSLIYVLIGLFYEKNLNFIIAVLILFFNIGLRKSWLITTPLLDERGVILNAIVNSCLMILLIFLTRRRYETMEIIKEDA